MTSYRLTKEADRDIESHYEYGILNFGLEKAQSYMLGLYDRIEYLSTHPNFGREAEELAPHLRRLKYGKHVIFYLPEDCGILIVRILREELDFPTHIKNND